MTESVEMPAVPLTLGRVAFEAYAETIGPAAMPRWESLPERFQSAWAKAASRAVERWIQQTDFEV